MKVEVLKALFDWGAVFFSLLAALLWLWSAVVDVEKDNKRKSRFEVNMFLKKPGKSYDIDFMETLHSQSMASAGAAICAAVAVLLPALKPIVFD